MPFKALFVATAPDADPEKHRTRIDTGLYEFHAVVVKDHPQALEVCARMVAEEGIQSVLLCPGHGHQDVAEIAAAVGDQVSVSVARGDARGGRVAAQAMQEAGWFARA
jgi:hypothetical protein